MISTALSTRNLLISGLVLCSAFAAVVVVVMFRPDKEIRGDQDCPVDDIGVPDPDSEVLVNGMEMAEELARSVTSDPIPRSVILRWSTGSADADFILTGGGSAQRPVIYVVHGVNDDYQIQVNSNISATYKGPPLMLEALVVGPGRAAEIAGRRLSGARIDVMTLLPDECGPIWNLTGFSPETPGMPLKRFDLRISGLSGEVLSTSASTGR